MALIHVPLPLPFIHRAAARANRGSADLPSETQTAQAGELTPGWGGRQRLWSPSVKTQSSNPGKPHPGSCADTEQLEGGEPPRPGLRGWGKPRWETAGVWGTPGGGTAAARGERLGQTRQSSPAASASKERA